MTQSISPESLEYGIAAAQEAGLLDVTASQVLAIHLAMRAKEQSHSPTAEKRCFQHDTYHQDCRDCWLDEEERLAALARAGPGSPDCAICGKSWDGHLINSGGVGFCAINPTYRPQSLSPTEATGDDVARAFALEGADELELRGRAAQSMVGAVPAIIHEEDRCRQQREIYEAEAERWFRLANAVRQIATLSPNGEGPPMCRCSEEARNNRVAARMGAEFSDTSGDMS